MLDDMSYIIEYYYDIRQKLWCAEVKDEEDHVEEFVYGYTQKDILYEIEILKKKYQVIRVTKTTFYIK